MQPTSTLFVKVAVKQRPLSKEPLGLVITAAAFPEFTATSVQFYETLPLGSAEVLVLNTIKNLQTRANAENVSVKVHPAVKKYVS